MVARCRCCWDLGYDCRERDSGSNQRSARDITFVSLWHGDSPCCLVRAERKLTLPFGLLIRYTEIMKKSIPVRLKKRGRPATGVDPLVAARFPQEAIDRIDAWAKSNGTNRSDAIRRLVELGLKGKR